MGSMKHQLDYRSIDPSAKSKEEKAEKPIVAAAIVFMPIIGALLLLIVYVLLHRGFVQ